LQRAHAQLFGQGEGLTIVGSSLVDTRGLATHDNVTKETVGMRLVAAPDVGTGEIEEASSKCARLVHAADEEQGFA
jgi:hypothetical protein